MRILALDSSGLVASVAVVEKIEEEEQVIAEYTVNYKKTHSQTLLPMLDTVSDMIELDLKTIDAIAVAGGPGSFTGLRIGSATAKGLGLAMNKPLIHIPTLEGLAYNLCGTDAIVCPIMDARRGQVYTGIYEFCGNELVVLEDQMAISIEELGDHLKKYDKRIIFLGDGVPVFRARLTDEILAEEIKAGRDIQFAPANMNRQRAASVGTFRTSLLCCRKDRDCHGTRAGLSAPVTGRTRAQGARSEIYTVKMYQKPAGRKHKQIC